MWCFITLSSYLLGTSVRADPAIGDRDGEIAKRERATSGALSAERALRYAIRIQQNVGHFPSCHPFSVSEIERTIDFVAAGKIVEEIAIEL